ncbi:CvpA family protein [Ottowia sp.]|uniref:CvpA family protein n=1 Tax=Ottowia sp. TaxID=1898956 RepID=UPI003A8AC380
MSAVDWICIAILLASLLLGAWRGLVYEVLAIAGWIVAFFVARWIGPTVGLGLPMGEASQSMRQAAGFALVFVVTAFMCGMMATLARLMARKMGARPVDRTFGAAFGVVRGVLLLVLAAALLRMTPLHKEPWWQTAASAPWLEMGLTQLQPMLPTSLNKLLSGETTEPAPAQSGSTPTQSEPALLPI